MLIQYLKKKRKSSDGLVKKSLDGLAFIKNFYECYAVKWIAGYLYFLYWPLYWVFDAFDFCFLINTAPGVGHAILELDNFFRMERLNELKKKRYIFLVKNHDVFKTLVSLYGSRFFFAASSTLIYAFLLPLFIRFPKVTLDIGISRMKWQLPEKKAPIVYGHPFVFQLTIKEGLKQHRKAYERRLATADYFPLMLPKEKSEQEDKLCLIHIKTDSINASALPTDPETYLPSLKFLQQSGYRFIFAGRERMPAIFEQFGMKNYAASKEASFKNDIALFSKADLAILGGSGIAFLADCYDKPFLYLNSWHLNMAMPSRLSVAVPALLCKENGTFLKFSEQIDLYLENSSVAEVAPSCLYRPRNASGEEILEGLKELLAPKEQSPLQKQFQELHPQNLYAVSKSRVSRYFLEKHQHLF